MGRYWHHWTHLWDLKCLFIIAINSSNLKGIPVSDSAHCRLHCGRRRCFVADQLSFMTHIREEEEANWRAILIHVDDVHSWVHCTCHKGWLLMVVLSCSHPMIINWCSYHGHGSYSGSEYIYLDALAAAARDQHHAALYTGYASWPAARVIWTF